MGNIKGHIYILDRRELMKIRDELILQKDGDQYFLVEDGDEEKALFVNSNSTTNFVLEILDRSDGSVTKEHIIDQITECYDVEREIVEKDLDALIEKMRVADILDE